MKLEHAQRRIDQAIGEELRVANSAGEVRTVQLRCTASRGCLHKLACGSDRERATKS
jgi:hypothetical protein